MKRILCALVVALSALQLKTDGNGAVGVLQMENVARIDDQNPRWHWLQARHDALTVEQSTIPL